MNSLSALQSQTSPAALAALAQAPKPETGEFAYVAIVERLHIVLHVSDDGTVERAYVQGINIIDAMHPDDLEILGEAAIDCRNDLSVYEVAE